MVLAAQDLWRNMWLEPTSPGIQVEIWMSNQDMCFHRLTNPCNPIWTIAIHRPWNMFQTSLFVAPNSRGMLNQIFQLGSRWFLPFFLPADPMLCCGQIWAHHKGWNVLGNMSPWCYSILVYPKISTNTLLFAKGDLTLLCRRASIS